MSFNEYQYLDALSTVLHHGDYRTDRTGVGTLSRFGMRAGYDLADSFPLLTTKKVYWKGVVGELLWFLSGDTNTKFLTDNNIHIWAEWTLQDGTIGRGYGAQWRDFGGVDQIAALIEGIKADPFSRRHIVNAWNVAELDKMALPPCHMMFQVYIGVDGVADLQLYQRSADMFLGVPFNIASYSLLLHMICAQTGYKPGRLIHIIGDAHIYHNHLEQVKEQLSRELKAPPQPTIKLNPDVKSIFDYTFDDIELIGYNPLPAIKGEVAV